MFYKCLLWGMGKQNNLLKVTVVTMHVGELVLMKQRNSETVGNKEEITPDPASYPLDHKRFSQKKCQDKEIQPRHKAKTREHRTTCIASCTLEPGDCSDSSKICREKEPKPIISKNKMTSLCKKSFFPCPFWLGMGLRPDTSWPKKP